MRNKYGCTIIDATPVEEIVPKHKSQVVDDFDSEKWCTIVCRNGTKYQCQKVILCAGPWTNRIIQPLS